MADQKKKSYELLLTIKRVCIKKKKKNTDNLPILLIKVEDMLESVGPLGTINNKPPILASTSDILLWTKCPDRMSFPYQSLQKWQNTNHRLYLEKYHKIRCHLLHCCYRWVERDSSYLLCSIRVNCETSVCHRWAIKVLQLAIKVGEGVEQINTEAIPTDQGWLMPDTCQMNQKISNSATDLSRLPVYM